MFALGAPIEMGVLIDGPLVHTRDKPGIGAKIWCDVEIFQSQREPASATVERGFMVLSKGIAGRGIEGRAHISPVAGVPILVQAESAIHAANPVEASLELPVRVHGRDARLLAYIAADASQAEVRALPV